MASNKNDSLLRREWKTFLSILFKPLVICPILITAILLYFANADAATDKRFSILLNILASISLGLAGGVLNDAYKELTGDNILIKKGLSAVRNLSLCRLKINNISRRAKEASNEEMTNLLAMLEKDIANATQEWNDIIPGVTEDIEVSYILLKEKEEELASAKSNLDRINSEKISDLERKGKLIDEQNKKIDDLQQQIRKLKIKTSSPIAISSSGTTITTPADLDHVSRSLYEIYKRRFRCIKCGKTVNPQSRHIGSSWDTMLCSECELNHARGESNGAL